MNETMKVVRNDKSRIDFMRETTGEIISYHRGLSIEPMVGVNGDGWIIGLWGFELTIAVPFTNMKGHKYIPFEFWRSI
jgi:hypothetical protein